MITYFQVHFYLYHRNSGDSRNGDYLHMKTFATLEEAADFYQLLEGWLVKGEDTNSFASDYCWDGYLTSIEGVYEITKRKITKPERTEDAIQVS